MGRRRARRLRRVQPIGDAIAFTHTEIDERFAGQGLGSVLVRAALDAVRERGLPVLPFCPFVRRFVARHPEYVDLVPAGQRARFGLEPAGGDTGADDA